MTETESEKTTESASLNEFFNQTQDLNLDNCAKEPIHRAGAIQDIGALIIFDLNTRRIEAYSETICEHLGIAQPEIGQEIQTLISALDADLPLIEATTAGTHVLLEHTYLQHQGQSFQAIYHVHDKRGHIEFLPEQSLDAASFRRNLRLINTASAQIMAAENFDIAMQLVADVAKSITAFAQVMIYQFQPDWSGKVLAEACDPEREPFKGLYFPASDIPEQVRYIMTHVPYRALANNRDNNSALISKPLSDSRPIDLTWSLLRASSTMHTQYLRNMGSAATFTVSLIYREQLWGILSCHHNKEGLLPFDLWQSLQQLAITLMTKLEHLEAKSTTQKIKKLRQIEEEIAEIIKAEETIEASIGQVMPKLKNFLNSDGFAFQHGGEIKVEGHTPPPETIHRLIKWATENKESHQSYITAALHRDWPEGREHIDTACGVLIEPIHIHRICHLVWFRRPSIYEAKWAGKPTNKDLQEQADGTHTLLPRNSFATWVELHRDRATMWTEAEISAAREILKNMLDLLSHQLELTRSNRNLKTFSFAAAHDLKAPLRHIRFALQLAAEAKAKDGAEETRELFDTMESSSQRLADILDKLTELLSVDHKVKNKQTVDLNMIAQEAIEALQQDIEQAQASVKVDSLPTIPGSGELLHTLFINLLGNSIKYSHPERRPEIVIDHIDLPDHRRLRFADNGIGIDNKYATTIFEPFARLNNKHSVAGTGLGLSIIKTIVECHQATIHLDQNYSDGARFNIDFGKYLHDA